MPIQHTSGSEDSKVLRFDGSAGFCCFDAPKVSSERFGPYLKKSPLVIWPVALAARWPCR